MITLKRFLSIPIALTCLWLSWIIYNQLTPSIPVKEELNWNSYNKELINEALRNKQSVFINFTAKWCLVCLLNDKTTLSTEQFKSFVKQNKIQLFKADWTTKDDAITDALRLYNRNSVPLYVYYNKGNSTPIILPQILTEGILESKIKDRLITQ
jgi:thiol:disulfide interchange protein DsbD